MLLRRLAHISQNLAVTLQLLEVIINVPIAIWVIQSQPDAVTKALGANVFCKIGILLWLISMCGILIFGIWRGTGKSETLPSRYVGLGLNRGGSPFCSRNKRCNPRRYFD
jgi:hypothetical protein